MARKREGARVLGPFMEGQRWRVIAVDAAGRRTSYTADTALAARRLAAKLSSAQGRIVENVVDEWTAARARSGKVLPATLAHQARRVRGLLGELLAMRLDQVTEKRAAAAYSAHFTTPSRRTEETLTAATHRFDLQLARALWNWAVKQGLASGNPWASVEPAGRISRGKLQLRPSEVRAFALAAEEAALDGDVVALAALLCLSMGLRSGEALAITPRDVDGGDLFVMGTKTKAARRRLKLSPKLQRLLKLACQGRGRTEPLCTASRQALHREVARLCERADVPVVCTHALRGTHASLSVEAGTSVESVARALGHTSTRITRRHYVSDEAAEGARIDAFETR